MTQNRRIMLVDTEDRIASVIRICAVCICVAVLLLSANAGPAVGADADRETLEGIRAFTVAVEDLKPDVQKYAPRFGLTKAQLRKDVEKWLRDAGIAVVDGENTIDAAAGAILYIHVNTVNYQKYWYSYTVSVHVKQIPVDNEAADVRVLRDIWSVDMSGTANIGTLNTVKENVHVLVGKFISAYKSANGKESKQK